jgi:hypothetical protein
MHGTKYVQTDRLNERLASVNPATFSVTERMVDVFEILCKQGNNISEIFTANQSCLLKDKNVEAQKVIIIACGQQISPYRTMRNNK